MSHSVQAMELQPSNSKQQRDLTPIFLIFPRALGKLCQKQKSLGLEWACVIAPVEVQILDNIGLAYAKRQDYNSAYEWCSTCA